MSLLLVSLLVVSLLLVSLVKSTLNPIRYHNPHTTSETLKYILYPLSGRGGDVPDRLGGSAAQVGFVGAVGVDEAA